MTFLKVSFFLSIAAASSLMAADPDFNKKNTSSSQASAHVPASAQDQTPELHVNDPRLMNDLPTEILGKIANQAVNPQTYPMNKAWEEGASKDPTLQDRKVPARLVLYDNGSIRSIDSKSYPINDNVLRVLGQRHPGQKRINLQESEIRSLDALLTMPTLEFIHINNAPLVDVSALPHFNQLDELLLIDCDGFLGLNGGSESLTRIDLSRCDSIMTVDLSRFPKLKILTVLACAFFRDLESGARIKTSPPVLALEDVCVESPKFSGDLRPLSYAPQLKYLDISSCANSIDLSQLLNASKWNGSLINLRFSNCKGTIDLIALKNFKRLERLSFNRCPHVTQAMIDDIKKDCPNLTVSYNPAKGF